MFSYGSGPQTLLTWQRRAPQDVQGLRARNDATRDEIQAKHLGHTDERQELEATS